MYTLYLGNKNYSTWSLRGWLAAKLSGAPFREVMVTLSGTYNAHGGVSRRPRAFPRCTTATSWSGIRSPSPNISPNGIPACGPPMRRRARMPGPSRAKCTRGSLHLRNDMTMCIRERVDVRPWSPELATDIARVVEIWTESRERFGKDGPYLMGAFTLADVFYAPVSFRFRTYGVTLAGTAAAYLDALAAHPFVREWEAAARAETTIVDADEPRLIYRDKIASLSAGGAAGPP